MICSANQFNGFYKMVTLALNELKRLSFTFHTVQLCLLENLVFQTVSLQGRIKIYVNSTSDSQAIEKKCKFIEANVN